MPWGSATWTDCRAGLSAANFISKWSVPRFTPESFTGTVVLRCPPSGKTCVKSGSVPMLNR